MVLDTGVSLPIWLSSVGEEYIKINSWCRSWWHSLSTYPRRTKRDDRMDCCLTVKSSYEEKAFFYDLLWVPPFMSLGDFVLSAWTLE